MKYYLIHNQLYSDRDTALGAIKHAMNFNHYSHISFKNVKCIEANSFEEARAIAILKHQNRRTGK